MWAVPFCVQSVCSPCLYVGPLQVVPFSPHSKTRNPGRSRCIITQSEPSTKCTDEDLHLVPTCCTAAGHFSSDEDGSNAEHKLHCTSGKCDQLSIFYHLDRMKVMHMSFCLLLTNLLISFKGITLLEMSWYFFKASCWNIDQLHSLKI